MMSISMASFTTNIFTNEVPDWNFTSTHYTAFRSGTVKYLRKSQNNGCGSAISTSLSSSSSSRITRGIVFSWNQAKSLRVTNLYTHSAQTVRVTRDKSRDKSGERASGQLWARLSVNRVKHGIVRLSNITEFYKYDRLHIWPINKNIINDISSVDHFKWRDPYFFILIHVQVFIFFGKEFAKHSNLNVY